MIWRALGDVSHYYEPFAGSLAVLLARPHAPRFEFANDLDGYITNFWRAVKLAPGDVARWSDWPMNGADLIARQNWLVDQKPLLERLKEDPEFFDAKIAGWWCWGVCGWIGAGFCVRKVRAKTPQMSPKGILNFLPWKPGCAGYASPLAWLEALSSRLRHVTIACGEWHRILSPASTVTSPTAKTADSRLGVLLDPPYNAKRTKVYEHDNFGVSAEVRAWALANGDNPRFRIALCGYEGEHEMPATWRKHSWSAIGGYGRKRGKENRKLERVWFSPHCLPEAA